MTAAPFAPALSETGHFMMSAAMQLRCLPRRGVPPKPTDELLIANPEPTPQRSIPTSFDVSMIYAYDPADVGLAARLDASNPAQVLGISVPCK